MIDDDASLRLLEATNRVYEQTLTATIAAFDADPYFTGLTGTERAIAWTVITGRAAFAAQLLAGQHGVPDTEIERWLAVAGNLVLASFTTPKTEKLQ